MRLSQQSTASVLAELGERIRRQRLNLNITQGALATKAGVGRSVIQKIERGDTCMLDGWLEVLRALGVLDQLDAFLPDPGISPVQVAKLQGRERKRATGRRVGPGFSRNEKGR